MEHLQDKRLKVLEAIKPICEAYGIKDYDYIVKETGQTETLRIHGDHIGCSLNSVSAVIDKLTGWIFVRIYCKNKYIGAFKTQTLNAIKRYWIKEKTK